MKAAHGTWQQTGASGGSGIGGLVVVAVLLAGAWIWSEIEKAQAARAEAAARAAEAAARAAALNPPDPGIGPYVVGALVTVFVAALAVAVWGIFRSVSLRHRPAYIPTERVVTEHVERPERVYELEARPVVPPLLEAGDAHVREPDAVRVVD